MLCWLICILSIYQTVTNQCILVYVDDACIYIIRVLSEKNNFIDVHKVWIYSSDDKLIDINIVITMLFWYIFIIIT